MANIRAINSDDTMSATDEVIVFDTNSSTGGTITLPAAADGKKIMFTPNNGASPGPAIYTLALAGTDSFDPAANVSLSYFGTTKLVALNGVWYAG